MGRPSAYSIAGFGWIIDAKERTGAYARAIEAAVKPGDLVFDIGAGTGVFATLACRHGARKAVAIETDDAVLLAPQFAAAAGCSDRLEIFHGMSTEFEPAERADLIISDLRGSFPLFERNIPSIVDARERLLKPGGTLIPARDRMHIALVESPATYRKVSHPWGENLLGLDLTLGRRFAANEVRTVFLKPEELLSAPALFAEIDYHTIQDPDFEVDFSLAATRDGTAHGLALWFDTDLYGDIGFSAGPFAPREVYGDMFLAFEQPVELVAGERATGTVFVQLRDGIAYNWSWRVRFERAGAEPVEFRQSKIFSTVLVPRQVRPFAVDHVPQPSDALAADRVCLELVDGQRSVTEIAAELRRRFPDRFRDDAAALDHVATVAKRYESGQESPR